MTTIFCGITAKRIETLNPMKCYCDRCCFQNAPLDCIDKVSCELGMYWKKISLDEPSVCDRGSNIVYQLLEKSVKMNIFTWKGKNGNTYNARRGSQRLGTYLTYKEAMITCLGATRDFTVEHIKKTEIIPQQGFYIYYHKTVRISSHRNLQKARKQAVGNVKAYYDILIEREENK